VRVQELTRDWPAIEAGVPKLRQRYPMAPVIIELASPITPDAIHLARRAAFLHVRAVVLDSEPLAETLRRIMPHPVDLAAEILDWLPLRGAELPPACVPLIREILRRALAHGSIADLLRDLGESEDAVRKRLRGCALPAPAGWWALARALCAALRLQAVPRESLSDVALACGYSEHSTLSRQMIRLFDLRPSAVRELLGWEPLADRWLARCRRTRGKSLTSDAPRGW
jgi:AraC-like DNA-binding protein